MVLLFQKLLDKGDGFPGEFLLADVRQSPMVHYKYSLLQDYLSSFPYNRWMEAPSDTHFGEHCPDNKLSLQRIGGGNPQYERLCGKGNFGFHPFEAS